jgi:hypothetical protein
MTLHTSKDSMLSVETTVSYHQGDPTQNSNFNSKLPAGEGRKGVFEGFVLCRILYSPSPSRLL